ncbi:hypothetical protein O3M35_003375 [Rhynocoris fuscipes]|uniref:Transcription factor Adf-1 n=1 Tax=Rhynocoris fuscipes TaxID=488301 RepID=A0AAW1CM91_9HEMI
MDVIKLIRSVKSREPLWDRKHEYYHDRTITMTMWEDVAYSLGTNSDSVRAKWKGLRDTFRGELKKLQKDSLNGQIKATTNWEYFEEMLFVKDQIYSTNKRPIIECNKSLVDPLSSNSNDESSSFDDVNGPTETKTIKLVDIAALQVQPTIETNANNSCHPGPPYPEDRTDFRRIHRTATDEDDDYSFLMSILPQLRCLPTTRNLYIRLKIQEMLYNEILKLQTA